MYEHSLIIIKLIVKQNYGKGSAMDAISLFLSLLRLVFEFPSSLLLPARFSVLFSCEQFPDIIDE